MPICTAQTPLEHSGAHRIDLVSVALTRYELIDDFLCLLAIDTCSHGNIYFISIVYGAILLGVIRPTYQVVYCVRMLILLATLNRDGLGLADLVKVLHQAL